MAYPISDVTRRVVYTGSAGVGPYSFSFEVLANTDIQVYKNTTLLTLTTNYTVTINANGTGSVTLVVAATGADTITIVGDRAIQRATDFVTGGDLFANTLNDEFDSLVIFAQQVDEKADRGLKAPVTDPTDVNMVLPVKNSRKGTVLAFDATTGDPIVGPTVGDISSASTYATNAAASASAASTSAGAASSSASAASSSASSASSSAAAAAASAASGMYSAVQDKSANYTVVAGDAGDLIRVTTTSGAITITLPTISTVGDGFKVAIVKWTSDGNAVSVVRSSTDTINGATSYSLGNQYSSATFVADLETGQWFSIASGLGVSNVAVDAFSGNNSTVAFTLSGDPGSENNTQVYVSGVYQEKDTYSVSGTTLTFSTAPPTGTSNIEVVWTAPLGIGVPSDGSVTTAKIASSVTLTTPTLTSPIITGSTPQVTVYTSASGTYTTPTNARWLQIRMIGGGGGGGGGNSGTAGTTGGTTTFGTSLLTCVGGTGSTNGSAGAGGTATGGDLNLVGGSGGIPTLSNVGILAGQGGGGAPTPFGGGGTGNYSGAGVAAPANSGAGGGGGGTNAASTLSGGFGGSAGGYLEKTITSPLSSYSYAVGTGGAGASAGTNGYAGASGGSGLIIITAYF